MATTVTPLTLKSLKPHLYGGKTYTEGEEFEAFSPLHARTLIAIKRAEAVEEEKAPKSAKAAKADTDEVPKAKAVEAKSTSKDTVGSKDNQYKTRKLTAEDK